MDGKAARSLRNSAQTLFAYVTEQIDSFRVRWYLSIMSFRSCTALLTVLILAAFDFNARAYSSEIYQFIDPSGTIHFTNVPTDPRYKLRDLKPKGLSHFERQMRELELETFINRKSENYEIDPALIKAVIRVESNFDSNAVSSAGAEGLMQLMPKTAASLEVSYPFDPEENIEGGTRYLRHLLNRFDQDLKLSLAAYNAGPESVLKYGGVPPFPETTRYISKVMHFYERYLAQKKPYQTTGSDGDILLSNRPKAKLHTFSD